MIMSAPQPDGFAGAGILDDLVARGLVQDSTDLEAMMRKPFSQAGMMRPYFKIGGDLDAASGSGKENGTSLH